jgi:hypothetical protein
MKKPNYWWQIFGFLFASAGGTLLHFVYEWSGESVLTAPISGINESTWEHMKLLFVPMALYAVVQSFFVKDASYWCDKALSSLSGLLAIPVLYYTLNGAFGKTSARVNIALFFVSAAVAYLLEYYLLKRGIPKCKKGWGILFFILVAVAFAVFTFMPPELPLFRDPVTGGYGIG